MYLPWVLIGSLHCLCSLWLARVILWFWFYDIQYRVTWPEVLESCMVSFYQANWCNSYLNPTVVWKLKGHTKWILVALIKWCAIKSTLLSLLVKITFWGTRGCRQFESSSLTSSVVNLIDSSLTSSCVKFFRVNAAPQESPALLAHPAQLGHQAPKVMLVHLASKEKR